MTSRRGTGEGSVYRRADGRWVARVDAGLDRVMAAAGDPGPCGAPPICEPAEPPEPKHHSGDAEG
jgi:hypothetical protein